jgi:hypothetical protein
MPPYSGDFLVGGNWKVCIVSPGATAAASLAPGTPTGVKIPPATLRPPLLAALLALAGPLRAEGTPPTDPVAVAASSTAEYRRAKFGPGAPRPESYLFFQGKYYGGTVHDSDLEHAQFTDIAKILAVNLVRQNYFPTKDRTNADLLIVVHWGATSTDVEPNYGDDRAALGNMSSKYDVALQKYMNGKGPPYPPDVSGLQGQLGLVDSEQGVITSQIDANARLLGFDGQIAKEQAKGTTDLTAVSTAEKDLITSLDEERYFVILMAYDYRSMKKGSIPKLLWSTRFSIRAPGNKFTAALPAMSKAAAAYFGRSIDGLETVKPALIPEGRIDVGEPKVIGNGKTP